ncbi:tetratricopeptide repeat protein [Olleya sp. HaHaR_3_96]|uniref:tetratricopeptide repeat protein n=1 Tax=Olleya sp. HaHaR_3_96 TaxID=2745560 RepID=UPI001C4EC0F0|nr:hypothetical protein [Olleya sp. HaHaR_3_96]QXP61810.1 hypothetical protein H0I26_09435 [Olleya sp. HaHaR_3_96]
MALKKLFPSLALYLLYSLAAIAQDGIKFNPKDTIAYNDANSEKVVALGSLIESSLHRSDPEVYISKFYTNVFVKRILDINPSITQNLDDIKLFAKGIQQGLNKFPAEIITELENGAYYDFVNYRYDEYLETYYILFRLYSSESGLNYHDYRIHKKGQDMQISDAYIYYSGENLSETMARLMGYAIPQKKILGLIKNSKNEGVNDLFKALRYKREGDFEKSYNTINTITSKISKEKFFLIFKSIIASNLDDDTYLNSLEELINTYSEDPTIVLNRIDYAIYKGNYFEAIQLLNQLQENTEDDFLNYLKANVAFQDENFDFALNNYDYIVQNYPDFFEGQAGYLNTLVMMKKYTEATAFIDTLISEGYERDSLINYIEEDDAYGENILDILVKSEAYKSWKLKTAN